VPPLTAFGGRGAGRARLLASFCSKEREVLSSPPVAKVEEGKPAHFGRGRAFLNLGSGSL
jgi:hypothetical protein